MVLVTPTVLFHLRRSVSRIVHDAHVAEAITADAIGKAAERVSSDRPTYFLAWLQAIARNMAFHWIRDNGIHEKILMGLPKRAERSAFASAMSREAVSFFDSEVKRLTENQRRALLMRIVDRLSFDEIGVAMKMRAGTARALVHRARHRLAEWLGYMRAL